MTKEQLFAVRQAYSDAFSEGMKVCAAVSAVCVLGALMTYRKHGVGLEERRVEQLREEEVRRVAERERKENS